MLGLQAEGRTEVVGPLAHFVFGPHEVARVELQARLVGCLELSLIFVRSVLQL